MRRALRLAHYYTDPSTRGGWVLRYDRINKISQSVKYCINYMLRSSWMRQAFRNMVNDSNAKWHWIYLVLLISFSSLFRVFPVGRSPKVGLPEHSLNFFSPVFARLKAQSVVCLILSFPKIYEHFWGPKEKRWSFLQSHNSPRHLLAAAVGLADSSYVCEKREELE